MACPKVSIITPVLNGGAYLKECIESVLNQTYPYVEHIFVDGGSKDGSVDIINQYALKFPSKVKLILQMQDGIGGAWNQGIENTKGEILGWLGADDSYVVDALTAVVDFFGFHKNVFFIYGGYNLIDQNGKIIISCNPEPYRYDVLLNKKQMIHTPTAFFKKEVIHKVGGIDKLGNDYDFYLRVGKSFSIHSINAILTNIRAHEGSQTMGASISKRKRWLKAWCQSCLNHGGSPFSSYCIKYYIFIFFGWALPVWNWIYFIIIKIFKKKLL